jgi:hypothetical protein
MDDSIAGSEEVYLTFQQMLGSEDTIAVGEALRRAKWHYVKQLGIGGLGVYEEKSLIETTLYGLPMYVVDLPVTVPLPSHAASPRVIELGQIGAAAYSVHQVPLDNLDLTLAENDTGQYYHIAGETQANPGRPLQPRTGIALPVVQDEIHGVIVWEAQFATDEPFDPSITRPVTDVTLLEPEYENSSWYPAKFWSLNTLDPADPRLVVIAGQYQSTTARQGIERVFNDLTFHVLTSSSSDASPPAIHRVEASGFQQSFVIQAEVSDSDTGVQNVWCTYEDQEGHWITTPLEYVEESGMWTGVISSTLNEYDFFIQAADGAGNVSLSGNKGLYFDAAPNKVYLPLTLRNVR